MAEMIMISMKMKGLVTGAAGFIGFHLCQKLLEGGYEIVGIDNLNDYYDVSLKKARISQIANQPNFKFVKVSLEERERILDLFNSEKIFWVIHLAAQAGVRYSLINPYAYIDSNIYGFLNILEACRYHKVNHLVFASSSSVYGLNTKMPFSVHQNVDHPISLYGATKKSNELMAHAYSYLFNLPATGLRFFTVYGPWGRPDMALFIFTQRILEEKPIDVYNYGQMERDFTYIDDIVEGIIRVLENPPLPNRNWNGDNPDASSSRAPFRIYNIGNNNPVKLLRLIEILEEYLDKKAQKNFLPLQPGDVPGTFADIDDLVKDVGFKPKTSIEEGVKKFVDWYRWYYKV